MKWTYESLKNVLSTIEAKKDFNKDNIIEKIKTELEIKDHDLYLEWEKGEFGVNHAFNSFSHENFKLLIIAASNGHANIVEVLLEKGADVNEKDWLGRTPLHFAVQGNHEKTVEVLLEKGADVNAVERHGSTALDYAKDYAKDYDKSKNVIKALLEAGGGSFLKASRKGKIAGGVTTLLGTAIAVALFTTGTITAQLIPIFIAVVAVTAAALVVGCATYALLKPSTKVGEVEKPSAVLITNEQQEAVL